MNFETLDRKVLSNDKTKINITIPTVIFASTTEITAVHMVTQDQVGRIDLISLMYYGNSNYCDYILKWNNISNPFILAEGDELEIPDKVAALASIIPIIMINRTTNSISIRDQFIDTKRIPAIDASRIAYLQRKASLKYNGSRQILPPNLLKEGDTNIIISNGIITI
jgi:hypothetical protein